MVRSLLCLLAVGLSAAAPDTDPPVISLDLEEGVAGLTHVYTSAQKQEICHTKEEWSAMLHGGEPGWVDKQCVVDGKTLGPKIYAKRCNVITDNESTCPVPKATAFDHHEGDISESISSKFGLCA